MNLKGDEDLEFDANNLALEDKWIISKYNTLVKEVTVNLDRFELGIAVSKLYDFIWDVFCDWYIEICKSRLNGTDSGAAHTARAVLVFVFTNTLKLLHPFMPFITEEIWQSMPHRENTVIMVSEFPKYSQKLDFSSEEIEFERIMQVIKAIRNRRAEMNVPPSKRAQVFIKTDYPETFKAGNAYICRLAYASDTTVVEKYEDDSAVCVVTDSATAYMPMSELVDVAAELDRLNKELTKAIADKAFFESKLNNKGFIAKAPEAVIEKQKEGLSKALKKIELIENNIERLKK